jgi:hypothetical protein
MVSVMVGFASRGEIADGPVPGGQRPMARNRESWWSDDADVLADAERRDRAAVPTDGTGHMDQVHMAAFDAAVGRHESSLPASPPEVNVSDQNYRN